MITPKALQVKEIRGQHGRKKRNGRPSAGADLFVVGEREIPSRRREFRKVREIVPRDASTIELKAEMLTLKGKRRELRRGPTSARALKKEERWVCGSSKAYPPSETKIPSDNHELRVLWQ